MLSILDLPKALNVQFVLYVYATENLVIPPKKPPRLAKKKIEDIKQAAAYSDLTGTVSQLQKSDKLDGITRRQVCSLYIYIYIYCVKRDNFNTTCRSEML